MIVPARPVPLICPAHLRASETPIPSDCILPPTVTTFGPTSARNAHIKAWDDAARLTDDKWANVQHGLARSQRCHRASPHARRRHDPGAGAEHARVRQSFALMRSDRRCPTSPHDGRRISLLSPPERAAGGRRAHRAARRAGRTICDACREACGGGARVGARLCLCEPSAFQFRFCSS